MVGKLRFISARFNELERPIAYAHWKRQDALNDTSIAKTLQVGTELQQRS